MRTATTKLRREVYEVFAVLCKKQGTTPYAVLKSLLDGWMEQQIKAEMEKGDPVALTAAAAVAEGLGGGGRAQV